MLSSELLRSLHSTNPYLPLLPCTSINAFTSNAQTARYGLPKHLPLFAVCQKITRGWAIRRSLHGTTLLIWPTSPSMPHCEIDFSRILRLFENVESISSCSAKYGRRLFKEVQFGEVCMVPKRSPKPSKPFISCALRNRFFLNPQIFWKSWKRQAVKREPCAKFPRRCVIRWSLYRALTQTILPLH
jgi:hypothetical protein